MNQFKKKKKKKHGDDGPNGRTMHKSITSEMLFGEGYNLSATECILPVDLHGFCIN